MGEGLAGKHGVGGFFLALGIVAIIVFGLFQMFALRH